MVSELSKNIIKMYENGGELASIMEETGVTGVELKRLLVDIKESNRVDKTYSNYFKKMIAKRDISGTPRRQIASELKVPFSVVRSSCIEFGQAFKGGVAPNSEFTKIEGDFSTDICPACEGQNVNSVDNMRAVYCLDCGEEHVFKFKGRGKNRCIDHALRVNWEYLD